MQLTPMRFTTVEGTDVTVKVNSPDEAKKAIRELKHRKKEVALHRRALQRLQKAALKERARIERAKSARAGKRGVLASLGRAVSLFRPEKPLHDLEAIERDLHLTEETMHNIDVCIVQIEGKLLQHG
jgi:hypothetical protein